MKNNSKEREGKINKNTYNSLNLWVKIAHIITPFLLFGALLFTAISFVQQGNFYRRSLRPILITNPKISVYTKKQEIKVKLNYENVGKSPAKNIISGQILTNKEEFPIKHFLRLLEKNPPRIRLFVPNGKKIPGKERLMPLWDDKGDSLSETTFDRETKIYHHNYLVYSGFSEKPIYYEQITHHYDFSSEGVVQISDTSYLSNRTFKGDIMAYTNLINNLPTVLMFLLTLAILWLAYEARKSSYRGALYSNQILGYLELRETVSKLIWQFALYTKVVGLSKEKKIESTVKELRIEFLVKLLKYGDILQKDLFKSFDNIREVSYKELSKISKKEEVELYLIKIEKSLTETQKIANKYFCLEGLNKESDKLLRGFLH